MKIIGIPIAMRTSLSYQCLPIPVHAAESDDAGVGDILFDGSNSTCMNSSTEHWVFHYQFINYLTMLPQPPSDVITVTVVGERLVCGYLDNELQISMNTVNEANAAYLCQLQGELKLCDVISAGGDTGQCQFQCQCSGLLPSGGCQYLYWDHSLIMRPNPGVEVCEVIIN